MIVNTQGTFPKSIVETQGTLRAARRRRRRLLFVHLSGRVISNFFERG